MLSESLFLPEMTFCKAIAGAGFEVFFDTLVLIAFGRNQFQRLNSKKYHNGFFANART